MIRSLTEMGFDEERSKKVLQHFKNNLNMAMDYLINTPPENDQLIMNSGNGNRSNGQEFVPNQESLTML